MSREEKDAGPNQSANSLAQGYAIAMQVIGASAQMVVFPLLGRWADGKLGTGVLFLLLGFVIGFYAAITQLIRISKSTAKGSAKGSEKDDAAKNAADKNRWKSDNP